MGKAVSFFIAGLLVGVLVATLGFSLFVRSWGSDRRTAAAAVTLLKLGHCLDTTHPVHTAMMYMAERVKEKSGGTVLIEIYPNAQLGSETESIQQLQSGALAMTKTSAAPLEGFVEEMAVFGLPYIFRDSRHRWNVLDGPIGTELLLKGERVGLRGLCYYDAGSRSFYTVEHPVLTPDDLRPGGTRLKIRVMNSSTAMDMIEALGGAPTPVPWGELYTVLQQNGVDGAENNPPSFLTSKHYEVCKHFSLDEHTSIPDILLISRSVWKKLDGQVKQWLEEAARESSVYQRDLWKKKTEEALKEVQEHGGVTVYRPDKAPFVAKVASMYARYDGSAIGELLARIREAQ